MSDYILQPSMNFPTNTVETRIRELAEPLAASLGLSIWGIETTPEGRTLVRLYVDSDQGVSIDQCADLSRMLGLALEVEDCMTGAYVLEVSSPGLDRRFFSSEQLAQATGRIIEITLEAPLEAWPHRRKFQGTLIGATDGQYRLSVADLTAPGQDPPVVEFSFSQLKKARQVHQVPEKVLPGKRKKGTDAGS